MFQYTLSKTISQFSGIAVLALIAARSASAQLPPPVQQLIYELPPCSVLRAELEGGTYGSRIDQPYMAMMRNQGVQRALFEVRKDLHGNRPEGIHIIGRLYFRQFDGPNSQIADVATLKAIEAGGLAANLDDLARHRVLVAPIIKGEVYFGKGNQLASLVEFFADAWLLEPSVFLARSGSSNTPLRERVLSEDVMGTRSVLQSGKFTKKQLDRALFDAVLTRHDNSAVIKLLLDAGADVNARTLDGTTPLMSAVARPCNLQELLAQGAELTAHDKWGTTALQRARDQKQRTAVRLLEEAAAKAQEPLSEHSILDKVIHRSR